jgi:hypothetical protein
MRRWAKVWIACLKRDRADMKTEGARIVVVWISVLFYGRSGCHML